MNHRQKLSVQLETSVAGVLWVRIITIYYVINTSIYLDGISNCY